MQDVKQKLDTLHPRNTLGIFQTYYGFLNKKTAQQLLVAIISKIVNYATFSGPNPNRLGLQSRQASSNSAEGNNRESSLDDSGVVDDHEPEGDATSEEVASQLTPALRVGAKIRTVLFAVTACGVF